MSIEITSAFMLFSALPSSWYYSLIEAEDRQL
jgi:hypothetical protein